MAVLRWMRNEALSIGGDGARIMASGDSAGGSLAAALPIKAREEGVALQATVLLCPISDFYVKHYESFERLA